MSAGVADLQSASIIVSATEQGMNPGNTSLVDSCFCNFKLLDCHNLNSMCVLVAFIRRFVDIDWVGLFAKICAKQSISGTLPSSF